ncbi:hypothetical protein [Burkholderia sp. 22PA0106]|uniref:hypothetical protein n=1 Tax=Burkholderia sp. 22PA0106 TaxID=3237371 RepID=UPI0039C2858E
MGAVATGLMLNPVIKGSADEAARLAELLDELKRLDNYAPKYFEAVRDLVGIARNNAIDRRDSSISAMIFFMISIVAIFLGILFLELSI